MKQSNQGETQSYNFCAYRSFGNSYSCITAVKWDAYDVENTVGKATRCHLGRRILTAFILVTGVKCSILTAFILVTGGEVFIWQNFLARLTRSRFGKPISWGPSQPALSYELIKHFTKDLKARRNL